MISDSENEANIYKLLSRIARKWLDVRTLDERGRDCLDFHDIHVNAIRYALEDAFVAGLKAGRSN